MNCPSRGCKGMELQTSHYFKNSFFCPKCQKWIGNTQEAEEPPNPPPAPPEPAPTFETVEKGDKVAADCTDHPKYGGVRKPRTDCPQCWALYEFNHPERASRYKAAE